MVGEISVRSRKRAQSGEKRKKEKEERYAEPKTPHVFEPCAHDTVKFAFHKFRARAFKEFNNKFYMFPDKIRQDSIVSTLVNKSEIKRRSRPTTLNKSKKLRTQHEYNVIYFLPTLQYGKDTVCKINFLSVVSGVGRTRLKNIKKKKKLLPAN